MVASANPNRGFDWSPQAIAKLRNLWGDGVTASEIGRVMHISKNSVISKVHRLNLPSRPSPIKRDGVRKSRARHTARVERVPGISAVSIGAAPLPALASAPVAVAALTRIVVIAKQAAPRGCCQWPFGDPGTKGFRFCGESRLEGRPYCVPHCRNAYVGFGQPRAEQHA